MNCATLNHTKHHILGQKRHIFTARSFFTNRQNVLCEEVALSRIYWFQCSMFHAEVRKLPTTVGATGSLSRTLAQYLDDVSSENYSTELQKMANLGTACQLRKKIMKHMNLFHYFPLSHCPRHLWRWMHHLYLEGVGPMSLYSPFIISFTLFVFIDISTVLHSHRPQFKTFLTTLIPDSIMFPGFISVVWNSVCSVINSHAFISSLSFWFCIVISFIDFRKSVYLTVNIF